MKTPYCEWLNQLANLAAQENLVIEARHHDVLEYYFKADIGLERSVAYYKTFLLRWRALNPDEPVIINGNIYVGKSNKAKSGETNWLDTLIVTLLMAMATGCIIFIMIYKCK